MKIVALMTTHNRVGFTMSSVSQLADNNCISKILVVDADSSDGTKTSVKRISTKVEVLDVGAETYWSDGMRIGFEYLERTNALGSHLLVCNDDIHIDIKRLDQFLNYGTRKLCTKGKWMLVGQFKSEDGEIAYGGLNRRHMPWLSFQKTYVRKTVEECDTSNFNLCLIPRSTLDDFGFLSTKFKHSGGDIEYGLRIKKSGAKLLVYPGYVGFCNTHQKLDSKTSKASLILKNLRSFYPPKAMSTKTLVSLYSEHGGRFWFIRLIAFYISRPFIFLRIVLIILRS